MSLFFKSILEKRTRSVVENTELKQDTDKSILGE